MAQQLLVQRGDRSVVPALKELALAAIDYRAKLHALWTLDGLDAIDADTVTRSLADRSPDVRASAIRLSERWLAEPDHPLQAAVLALAEDANWSVRRQLAASLGALPPSDRVHALTRLLIRYADDPITVDAAISGLQGREAAVLTSLLAEKTPNADAIAMLAGAATKSRDRDAVQQMIAAAADTNRPQAQRLALLRGLDAGITGAVRPTGGLANATGAAAAAGAGAPGVVGGGGRGRGGQSPSNLFAEEPTRLTALASGTGAIADAARQIVARISWPGKPASCRRSLPTSRSDMRPAPSFTRSSASRVISRTDAAKRKSLRRWSGRDSRSRIRQSPRAFFSGARRGASA